MRRTEDEISNEIKELKRIRSLVPPKTMFGDDNIAAIDAQVEALEDELTEDDAFNRQGNEWTEREVDSAREAINWRDGESSEKPSGPDGWGSLVKTKNKK